MKKIAAIIPIKQNSIGLKDKNFKRINSHELYEITINQALSSKRINKIYITTNSLKIIKKYEGHKRIEVIKRPESLCGKNSSIESAILHIIKTCKNKFIYNDIILLQVTSPLRKKKDLDKAINKYFRCNFDSLFSSNILDDHLYWIKKNQKFVSVNYDYKKRGIRQNRKKQFLENGSIYIFNKKKFLKRKNRLFGRIGIFEMDFWQQFEIDNYNDYIFCKKIYLSNKSKII
jgi:CMP-N,N'-diacetyllegionaminic acid synthase